MNGVAQRWFKHEKIDDDLYLITEPHYSWVNRANIWLVCGRDADLLLDTGLGVCSLKQYLLPLLNKPLKVVASHIHFDHAGGCHEFDDVFIHAHEHRALIGGDQALMLTLPEQQFVPQSDFDLSPYEGFSADEYTVRSCPHAKPVVDGDVIDLGDKAFEVMHLPGHSSGSIGLLDRSSGRFFSGDVVYEGDLLDDLDDSVIDDYVVSMERLLRLRPVETRPGHYGSLDARRLETLVRQYLAEKGAPRCPAE